MDSDFISLKDCAKKLNIINRSKWLLKDNKIIVECLYKIFEKIFLIVPLLSTVEEDEDYEIAKSFKEILFIYKSLENNNNENMLVDAFKNLLYKNKLSPTIERSVISLLYSIEVFNIKKIKTSFDNYFKGSYDMKKLCGRFLKWLFIFGKDIVFYNNYFLETIENSFINLSIE